MEVIIIIIIGVVFLLVLLNKMEEPARKRMHLIELDNLNIIWSNKQSLFIKYEKGLHEKVIDSQKGKLAVNNENLEFRNWLDYNLVFSIPFKWINNIVYDTSEKITLGRALMFGVLSLGMQKKTYVLIIEYTTDNNIKNQLVFNCFNGTKIDKHFIENLNVYRNKYFKDKINEPNTN